MHIFTFFYITFLPIQLPIRTLMFCNSTSSFLTLKSALVMLISTLNTAGKIMFLDCGFFYIAFFFFLALHSSIAKPFSVTSKTIHLHFQSLLSPVPSYLMGTHLLLWDWSCLWQHPALMAASTSHFFCTPVCTLVLPPKLLSCWEDLSANTFKATSSLCS